jgi:hypothetical protein
LKNRVELLCRPFLGRDIEISTLLSDLLFDKEVA